MIRYNLNQMADGRFVIYIEGHAEAGPKGQDLVCAASSALASALNLGVMRLEAEGRTKSADIRVADGDVSVDFTPAENESERALGLVNTITDAFVWLESCYPDNVCVV